jgi:hypothetical protein
VMPCETSLAWSPSDAVSRPTAEQTHGSCVG